MFSPRPLHRLIGVHEAPKSVMLSVLLLNIISLVKLADYTVLSIPHRSLCRSDPVLECVQ